MNSKLNGAEWPFRNFEREFSLVKIFAKSDKIDVKEGLFEDRRYKIQPFKNFGEWKCGYVITEHPRFRIIQTFEGEIKYREIANVPFYINFIEQLAWIPNRYLDLVSEALQLKDASKFYFNIYSLIFNYEKGLTTGLTIRNISFTRRKLDSTVRISYSGLFDLKELVPEFKNEYDLVRSDIDIRNMTLSTT